MGRASIRNYDDIRARMSRPRLASGRLPVSPRIRNVAGHMTAFWPAPGSEDTELGVLMEPEVGHGETEVYTRVQA
jgi:hypothetical protein